MSDDYLKRINSTSKALADAIREYTLVLTSFGSEVEAHYYYGPLKDPSAQRSLEFVIDGALATISSYTSDLQSVQTSLHRAKNSLNPVNSLHPELLAQVFSLIPDDNPLYGYIDFFDSYPADSYSLGMYNKKARLNRTIALSSVCRYWRHVALGTSTFWTYIPFYLVWEAAQRTLDRAPILLNRARTTPIDISIDMRGARDTAFSRTMFDKALALPLSSKDIGTLFLSVPATTYLNHLLNTYFGHNASILLTKPHVDLRGPSDDPSTLQDWLPRFQELQVLQLNPGTLHHDHFGVLPKLVELDLFVETSYPHPLPMKRLANILRACPCLQRLQLRDVEFSDATDMDLTPIVFSNLNTIGLRHVHVASVLPLLSSRSDSLNLTILANDLYLSSDNLADHINVFCQRTTVTGLHLDAGGLDGDLHVLLSLFPHLLTLSLENLRLDDLTVQILQEIAELHAEAEADPSPLPALQAIWLTGIRLDTEETLRSLVSVWPLRQLKLVRCILLSTESILQVQPLVDYLFNSVPDLIITD